MFYEIFALPMLISIIISFFKNRNQFEKQKLVAVEAGTSPYIFSLFNLSYAFYIIPVIITTIYKDSVLFTEWFPFAIIFSYSPGIIITEIISSRIEVGYDYQRKAAKKLKEVEYVGWFCLLGYLILWGIFFIGLK